MSAEGHAKAEALRRSDRGGRGRVTSRTKLNVLEVVSRTPHGGICTEMVQGNPPIDFNSPNILVRQDRGSWRVAAILDWEFALIYSTRRRGESEGRA